MSQFDPEQTAGFSEADDQRIKLNGSSGKECLRGEQAETKHH